jgi:hypothetical protein
MKSSVSIQSGKPYAACISLLKLSHSGMIAVLKDAWPILEIIQNLISVNIVKSLAEINRGNLGGILLYSSYSPHKRLFPEQINDQAYAILPQLQD